MAQWAATAVLGVLLVWALAPHTRIGRRTRARARLRWTDPRVADRLRPARAPTGAEELGAVEEMARAGILAPAEAKDIRRDLEAGGVKDADPQPLRGPG